MMMAISPTEGSVEELVNFEGEPSFYIGYDIGNHEEVGLDELLSAFYIPLIVPN